MSEKSLEIFVLMNEEVDSRMESLLNLTRDVSNAAVRFVFVLAISITKINIISKYFIPSESH